jgi:uncharacterized protein YecT (DUF1311 family)
MKLIIRAAAQLAVLCICVVVLSGCSSAGDPSDVVSIPQLSASSATESPSSEKESAAMTAPLESTTPEDSQTVSFDDESFPQASEPASKALTSNEEFNAYFLKNPIDQAYTEETKRLDTTQDLVEVANRFTGYWETEVEHAYQLLSTKLEDGEAIRLQREQDDWHTGLEANIQQFYNQDTPGSIGRLNAAIDTMYYYRDRAVSLYQRLYPYDQNFQYAYNG